MNAYLLYQCEKFKVNENFVAIHSSSRQASCSSNTGKSVVLRSHRGSNSHALGVILTIWPSIMPNILMPKIDAHSQNFLLLTMLH